MMNIDLEYLIELLEQSTGHYVITYHYNGNEIDSKIFTDCNDILAKMLGINSRKEFIEKKFSADWFFIDKEEFMRFDEAVREASRKHQPLLDQEVKIRTNKGKEKWISIDSIEFKKKGRSIGRHGFVKDISELKKTRSSLIDLEKVERASACVHALLRPMVALKDTVEIMNAQIYRQMLIKKSKYSYQHISNRSIIDVLFRLRTRYEDINIMTIMKEHIAFAMDVNNIVTDIPDKFGGLDDLISSLNDILIKEKKLDSYPLIDIQEILVRIYNYIINNIDTDKTLEKKVRGLKEELLYGDALFLDILSQHLIGHTAMMELELSIFKDLLMGTTVKDNEFIEEDLNTCFGAVIQRFRPEAALHRLEIRTSRDRLSKIKCMKNGIQLMFSYILDNAIKYSFYRYIEETKRPYINIKYNEYDFYLQNLYWDDSHFKEKFLKNKDDYTIISISDYGIGVTEEELKTGTIFNNGVRGKLTWDRNREGYGIGLFEAKRIAKLHSGDILIRSKRMDSISGPVTNNTPHLTTVYIILAKEPV